MNLAPTGDGFTHDKPRVPLADACRQLQKAGADVVGINCFAGPDTFIPLIRDLKKSIMVRSCIVEEYLDLKPTSENIGIFFSRNNGTFSTLHVEEKGRNRLGCSSFLSIR